MMSKGFWAAGLIVTIGCLPTLGLSGCGGVEEEIEGVVFTTNQQYIFNGSPPDAPEHQAVVALLEVKGNYAYFFCSGTLIRPDVVLTAGHCLKAKRASRVRAFVGDVLKSPLTLYSSSSLLVHPAYSSSTITNDLALLKLTSPVVGVTPVPEAPANIGLRVGELLNFAGFGQTETGSYGTKLQVDGTLDGFGCALSCGCPSTSGVPATQICYDQSTMGPCFGDSGGPAFAYRSGKAYVAGMTSYGDQYCTIYGVSTRADAFETFIHGFAGAN